GAAAAARRDRTRPGSPQGAPRRSRRGGVLRCLGKCPGATGLAAAAYRCQLAIVGRGRRRRMSGIVPTCMSRGAARAWMLVRWVVPVIALTLVALALPARAAPAIDYDPGRSDALRECDQHQY